MKTLSSIMILISVLFQNTVQAQNQHCDAEELQMNFISLMQLEDLKSNDEMLDGIVSSWDSYKCDYLAKPEISEFFILGHLDFLVEELVECSPRSEREDIKDACLESIKTLGLLHYMSSNSLNGLSQLAITTQLFYEVKHVAFDEMLDKYEWNEFKDMAEKLNDEWSKYERLPCADLSICNGFENAELHENLVSQATICMKDILASFDSAYRTDFELPCLEMEDALNSLFAFYIETKKIGKNLENQYIK